MVCTVYTYTVVARVRSTGPGACRFSLFKAAATLAAHRACRAYRVMRSTSAPTEFFFFVPAAYTSYKAHFLMFEIFYDTNVLPVSLPV